jgi:hypothetical protein
MERDQWQLHEYVEDCRHKKRCVLVICTLILKITLFESTGIKHLYENTVLLRNGFVTCSMKQCVVVKSTSY